jgi:hypothetical protein
MNDIFLINIELMLTAPVAVLYEKTPVESLPPSQKEVYDLFKEKPRWTTWELKALGAKNLQSMHYLKVKKLVNFESFTGNKNKGGMFTLNDN